MSMKLYVGNLSFDTSSNELQTLFAQTGTVESVSLIEDRETGRSRGFGFIEMSTNEQEDARRHQGSQGPLAPRSSLVVGGFLTGRPPKLGRDSKADESRRLSCCHHVSARREPSQLDGGCAQSLIRFTRKRRHNAII